MGTRVWPRFPDPPVSSTFIVLPAYLFSPGNTHACRTVCPHRIEDLAHPPDTLTRRNGNGPPQPAPQSHLFRTGPAAPRAQHHHRIDVRGRPPLPLHDARRLRPARPRRGDPAGTRRMAAAYARAARRRGGWGAWAPA